MNAREVVVRAEGLARRLDGVLVVANATLSVAAGEWLAVLGPSGCGKTTLLQLLGLLDTPSAGSLFLDGRPAAALSDGERTRLRLARIGFVFQQHNLLGHLSARDNVALPAWRLGGSRRAAVAAAAELLDRLGLSARASAPAAQLSPGETQRAAIARALINRPALVLADEPTGSLDTRSAARVLDAFEEVRQRGTALVVVTHDAAVAARAERRVRMQEGQLVGSSNACPHLHLSG